MNEESKKLLHEAASTMLASYAAGVPEFEFEARVKLSDGTQKVRAKLVLEVLEGEQYVHQALVEAKQEQSDNKKGWSL